MERYGGGNLSRDISREISGNWRGQGQDRLGGGHDVYVCALSSVAVAVVYPRAYGNAFFKNKRGGRNVAVTKMAIKTSRPRDGISSQASDSVAYR